MSFCSRLIRVSINNCRILISRHTDTAPFDLIEEEFDAPLWNTSIMREPTGFQDASMFELSYQGLLHSFTVDSQNTVEFYVGGALTAFTDPEDLMNQIRTQQAACSLP